VCFYLFLQPDDDKEPENPEDLANGGYSDRPPAPPPPPPSNGNFCFLLLVLLVLLLRTDETLNIY
jgi:hypothetical protein